jgi:DNA modification methylase
VTATVLRADALALPLADETVDLIVTSPPYFGLRSYTDGGAHYAGQLGSEATPAEFVEALLATTREMVRVLKPSGSIWVNLGDCYSSKTKGTGGTGKSTLGAASGGHYISPEGILRSQQRSQSTPRRYDMGAVREKSLVGIPWRYALACIDQLGLILRAEVIWSKPNGLPESVTDRVRRSHEQWFHFVRQPRYYSAVDEIREEHAPAGLERRAYAYAVNDAQRAGNNPVLNGEGMRPANPLGKLPGSVWTVPTEPLTVPPELGVVHFAAFPTEWPRRIIQGWTPSGICTACGEGRRPDVDRTPMEWRESPTMDGRRNGTSYRPASGTMLNPASTTITGYVCACPTGRTGPSAPIRPAVVLDPFGGTGTVALVADILGRHGISVDLSADYNRLAQWRTTDPAQRAKAARVEKPPPVIDGQLTLEVNVEPVPSTKLSGGLAAAERKGRDCIACGYRTQYAKGICDRCLAPLEVGA